MATSTNFGISLIRMLPLRTTFSNSSDKGQIMNWVQCPEPMEKVLCPKNFRLLA